MMNIINGGAHADNTLDIQEFMILPVGAPTFREALRYGAEVFHTLKKLLAERGLSTAVGDEGGFAPNLESNEAALAHASSRRSRRPATSPARTSASVSTRRARSSLPNGRYDLEAEKRSFTAAEFTAYLADLAAQYPIITIEDGMSEADWDGWVTLTRALGGKLQLVGDDLFVTNTRIFHEAIARHIANAILIKPNQIGTLTETLAAIDMADKARYAAVISHRSGETEDSTIADIAVASAATQIKTGSLSRSDRIGQVQPAAAHRGRARHGALRRPRGVPGQPLSAAGGAAAAAAAAGGVRRRASWPPARRRTGAGTLVACARIAEAAGARHLLYRARAAFEHRAGGIRAQPLDRLRRRHAGLRRERRARNCARSCRRARRVVSTLSAAARCARMNSSSAAKRPCDLSISKQRRELRLPAWTAVVNDQVLRGAPRHRLAQVLADQRERQVDPRGDARRGPQLPSRTKMRSGSSRTRGKAAGTPR